MGRLPTPALLVTLALLPLVTPAVAEDYEKAYAYYRAALQRPSLHKRILGRERLAQTEDARALGILAASYSKAEKPKDQVRYLIASIAADNFWEAGALPVYERWRAKSARPEDAWLWYRSLISLVEVQGSGELEAIYRSDRNCFLRAAAMEAWRPKGEPRLLALLPDLLSRIPADGVPRAVLIESLAACLAEFKAQRTKPEFRPAAEAIIACMDEAATLPRSRVVLARCLSRALAVPFVYRSGEKWQSELEIVQHGGKIGSLDGYAKRPTFAGIEATGDRICYVIDMSDSMCEPLTQAEMEKLPRGPISGSDSVARKEKESESLAWKRAFEAVRWDRVKTRFDAARELLKVSLLLLDEEKHFSVIWFGDAADTLKSTNGMVRATGVNVRKAISELDSITPGSKNAGRPHGTLRGYTNMHGGLHRAFKLRGQGMVGPGEYVDAATFEQGCDTIFLLSDGDPTWDDWADLDKRDPEDRVGDPETGATGGDGDQLRFGGPYRRFGHLAADVRRLNLFRKAEIHCVGMGEATMGTLERLAGIGHGQAISLRGQ